MSTARKKLKLPSQPNPALRDTGSTLPVTEQAKDVLSGITATYEAVEPEEDLLDRLAANSQRRLRGGTSCGAKPMLRRIMGTPDSLFNYQRFTVDELCHLTGKTEVNVRTCLADLRSLKFCGKEGPFVTKMIKEAGMSFYIFDQEATAAALAT
jgi:hypothetical protein